ncbi:hypothetical protein SAMN06265784_104176 [Paraburkholderia susongensis]|uniref:Uncharacterized protein n=1 Tax=Paraburkholderia susongensis TaxID=1515439 RepID=A0A1X7KRB6_9BURK|nr:hypothetical protein SAMN06265784_104176 [Paraburkholderia susongensis]
MNVRILETGWGPERNGYRTYSVKALIGSVRTGTALYSSRCVHHHTYEEHRSWVEENVHAALSKSLMERLLEKHRAKP